MFCRTKAFAVFGPEGGLAIFFTGRMCQIEYTPEGTFVFIGEDQEEAGMREKSGSADSCKFGHCPGRLAPA